jgi:PAS domain S-box-containing protein
VNRDNARDTGPEPLISPELRALVGPYLATTPHGTITDINEQAEALLGTRRRVLVGKPLQALVPADFRPAFRRELAKVANATNGVSPADAANRLRRTFVTRLGRRNGVPFEAELTIHAALAHGWSGDGFYIAIRDVTEREQAQQRLWELNADLEQRIVERTGELELLSQELARRHAYLETVVQHMPAGVVIADAVTGEVTMTNERAREIAGVEPARRLSTGLAPLERALGGETINSERVTIERADGRRAVLEVNAAPIHGPEDEVIAAAVVFQDVSAAEARRRASVEFVANAAHELRTPLAAIVSGVEVLESGAKEIPAERDRFLVHIDREAQRLVRLTRALLLLARIQSGVEEARAEVIELAPLLASVAEGLRPAAGVKVVVRCPSNAASIANRGLLEQALTSIATNAARYTETGRITLSVAQPNGRVRIRVRDTGQGMSPADLARAGERFFRGDDPATAGGFGLGLAITSEAVQAMGGRLVLASERGKGTTADIELPAATLVGIA